MRIAIENRRKISGYGKIVEFLFREGKFHFSFLLSLPPRCLLSYDIEIQTIMTRISSSSRPFIALKLFSRRQFN
jgi:hypothetical protein